MNVRFGIALGIVLSACVPLHGQTAKEAGTPSLSELEKGFLQILRSGDALQFLSYVPEDGVNLGRHADHVSKTDVEEQLTKHAGLYCKLFDTSCLHAEDAAPSCSYRELLNGSQKVRIASTETTRNNVRQAILVAEVQNDRCGGHLLIDFIFNQQAGTWKLFSIP